MNEKEGEKEKESVGFKFEVDHVTKVISALWFPQILI